MLIEDFLFPWFSHGTSLDQHSFSRMIFTLYLCACACVHVCVCVIYMLPSYDMYCSSCVTYNILTCVDWQQEQFLHSRELSEKRWLLHLWGVSGHGWCGCEGVYCGPRLCSCRGQEVSCESHITHISLIRSPVTAYYVYIQTCTCTCTVLVCDYIYMYKCVFMYIFTYMYIVCTPTCNYV